VSTNAAKGTDTTPSSDIAEGANTTPSTNATPNTISEHPRDKLNNP
jgi:hypothetical protein